MTQALSGTASLSEAPRVTLVFGGPGCGHNISASTLGLGLCKDGRGNLARPSTRTVVRARCRPCRPQARHGAR
jgi:hypothetical protein